MTSRLQFLNQPLRLLTRRGHLVTIRRAVAGGKFQRFCVKKQFETIMGKKYQDTAMKPFTRTTWILIGIFVLLAASLGIYALVRASTSQAQGTPLHIAIVIPEKRASHPD